MAGVDVQQRKGDAAGRKGAPRQLDQDDRVLAAGEEQDGALKLGGHLAHHEDRFGFQLFEVRAQ